MFRTCLVSVALIPPDNVVKWRSCARHIVLINGLFTGVVDMINLFLSVLYSRCQRRNYHLGQEKTTPGRELFSRSLLLTRPKPLKKFGFTHLDHLIWMLQRMLLASSNDVFLREEGGYRIVMIWCISSLNHLINYHKLWIKAQFDSMPRRLRAVLRANGWPTKY